MANSPVLYGPDSISNNLQSAIQLSTQRVLAYDGARNYIGNTGFTRAGVTTGWSLGTATLTSAFPSGVPTFGSGASGNLSIATSATSPISGLYSLLYASSAASTAGNFLASDALTLQREDQGKVLQIKFAYEASVNPANMNFSGTSSNSFGVAIYDVTNSAWIQPAGVYNLGQNSGVGLMTGTFQTPINMTSFRLVVFNANASAGAATLKLDDFFVGPQITAAGAAMSDWVSYTPTVTATTSNPTFGAGNTIVGKWRRVGDSIQLHIRVANPNAGTAGSGVYIFGLPAGLSIDTNKITLGAVGNNGLDASPLGIGEAGNTLGTASFAVSGATVTAVSASGVSLVYQTINTGGGGAQQVGYVSQALFPLSGIAYYTLNAEVPIVGWSSQTVMSNDTDTRVVDFKGNGPAGTQALTASVTNISMTSVRDSAGAWSGSTYVVPVAGDYTVAAFLYSTTLGFNGVVYVNGVMSSYLLTSLINQGGSGSVIVPNMKSGDIISVRSSNTTTLANDSFQHISIQRISGPATIAATESVNMRYTNVSGQSLNNISNNIITNWTKDYDSHNAFNATTGSYTVPVPGKYELAASVTLLSATFGAGLTLIARVLKSGAATKTVTRTYPIVTGAESADCTDTISCVAGDTLAFSVYQSSGSNRTLTTNDYENVITIRRTGN